jgi:membrane protein DedA with SNARE-associated domain
MDTVLQFLQTLQGFPAYALVLGMLVACGIGAPFNEDIVLLAASALTLNHVMEPVPLLVVAWFGILMGDGLVFHWGHRFGARLLRSRFFARIVSEEKLEAMQNRIRVGGPYYIFVIRFLPGIRTALFFAAGSLKLPYRQLFIYDGAAAVIELPLLVYGVRYVGGNWQEILQLVEHFQNYIVVGVLGAIGAAVVWRRIKSSSKKEAT